LRGRTENVLLIQEGMSHRFEQYEFMSAGETADPRASEVAAIHVR
jgi:hypothetical protein